MSDIVEWLRDRAFRKSGPTMEAAHTKQQEWIWANEVERLRAENEKLRAEAERHKAIHIETAKESSLREAANQDLRAENEKLRAALDDAAVELEFAHFASMNKRYKKAAKIARKAAALKETINELA